MTASRTCRVCENQYLEYEHAKTYLKEVAKASNQTEFIRNYLQSKLILRRLTTIIKQNEMICKTPDEFPELVKYIRENRQVLNSHVKKMQLHSRKLAPHFPSRNKLIESINILIKQIRLISQLNLNSCEKEADKMAASSAILEDRKVVATPVPMVITLTVYVISFGALITLTVSELIPIISCLISFIPLSSFFLTALHDCVLWRKSHC
ncbi:MAG TPA: hypothetical protein VEC37_13765 [Bacillota bacterium]|nr:hypothetical protein [Bacillota bacterium]